jgi:hypothetical protein
VRDDVSRRFPRRFVFAEPAPLDEKLLAATALAASQDALKLVDVFAEVRDGFGRRWRGLRLDRLDRFLDRRFDRRASLFFGDADARGDAAGRFVGVRRTTMN